MKEARQTNIPSINLTYTSEGHGRLTDKAVTTESYANPRDSRYGNSNLTTGRFFVIGGQSLQGTPLD